MRKIIFSLSVLICFLFSCGTDKNGESSVQVAFVISEFKSLETAKKFKVEYIIIENNPSLSGPGTRDPRKYQAKVALENKKAYIKINAIEPGNYNHIVSIFYGERKVAQTIGINFPVNNNSRLRLRLDKGHFDNEKAIDTNGDGVKDLTHLLSGKALCEAKKGYCHQSGIQFLCKDGFEVEEIVNSALCPSFMEKDFSSDLPLTQAKFFTYKDDQKASNDIIAYGTKKAQIISLSKGLGTIFDFNIGTNNSIHKIVPLRLELNDENDDLAVVFDNNSRDIRFFNVFFRDLKDPLKFRPFSKDLDLGSSSNLSMYFNSADYISNHLSEIKGEQFLVTDLGKTDPYFQVYYLKGGNRAINQMSYFKYSQESEFFQGKVKLWPYYFKSYKQSSLLTLDANGTKLDYNFFNSSLKPKSAHRSEFKQKISYMKLGYWINSNESCSLILRGKGTEYSLTTFCPGNELRVRSSLVETKLTEINDLEFSGSGAINLGKTDSPKRSSLCFFSKKDQSKLSLLSFYEKDSTVYSFRKDFNLDTNGQFISCIGGDFDGDNYNEIAVLLKMASGRYKIKYYLYKAK